MARERLTRAAKNNVETYNVTKLAQDNAAQGALKKPKTKPKKKS
jgi:hypothetical protein